MAEKDLGIFEAIEIAMDAELKAHNFYADAVKKVTNERGKNMLEQLAKFELNHYNILKELKDTLNTSGQYVEYKGTEFESYKIEDPSEVSGKIEKNKDEVLDVLKIAIDAEQKAHDHYTKMANQTSDPRGKEMFEKLAEEESLHKRILNDEFYSISNEGGVWSWGD